MHRTRPARRRALAAAVSLAAACGDATAPPLPSAGAPQALDISWSGYGGGSTRVLLENGRLRYTYVAWDERVAAVDATIAPDSATWAAFWQAAERVGLRTWPRTCTNPDVADGGGLSLDLTYGGTRLQRSTTNASPGRGGRCERGATTAEETGFLAAVRALVGQPFPGVRPTAATLPREGAPTALRVTVWQLPAGAHDVVLRGDTLVVMRRGFGAPPGTVATATVVPTAAAWREFWASAERVGLVRWPRDCADQRIADGQTVSVALAVPQGGVLAAAVNAYPTAAGGCVPLSEAAAHPDAPAALTEFLAAVSRLVGQPFP